jgi:hypothetical protein
MVMIGRYGVRSLLNGIQSPLFIKAVKNPVSIIEPATNNLNDFCLKKNRMFNIAGMVKNSDDNSQTAM